PGGQIEGQIGLPPGAGPQNSSAALRARAVNDGLILGKLRALPLPPVAAAAPERRDCMFLTKKHLPRRTFLRGVGATLALPLLDSMVPAFASNVKQGPRIGFVYVPHGAIMSRFTPDTVGKNFEFKDI